MPSSSASTTALAPSRSATAPAAARAVLSLLERLSIGSLELHLPDGGSRTFGPGVGPRATLVLHDWELCSAALTRGDIGVAESWIDGHWSTPDLVALLRLLAVNRDALDTAVYGSWWGSLAARLRHWMNRNSRRGSRRNIPAHYDLGNAFYREWLDGTMNYSSALFAGDLSQPMESAQQAKLRRALDACGVREGQRLLEIGCGWGALAEAAARERGAQVTGVTLSTEQLAYATQRVQDAGVAARVDLRLQDYRDIPETGFDAIASIEMFEAVGRAYWPGYFKTVRDKLKPGGLACIQTITIRDDLFERYVRSTDFIQQYIFPGGLLPSPAAFREAAARAGLEVIEAHAFGADYAETLRRWRVRFLARDSAVRALGFDTRFQRIWEFYLAYCEAAFATGNTDVVQFTLRRPA